VSPTDMVQSSLWAAKKAAKSASEIRTTPLIRCTGRAPDLIQRRTLRVETSRQSATSLILKKRGAERAARRVIDHGPLLFWPGIGHATPKNRSSDGTLINLRAPIFVHSISPLFILL
jgi:hypothetical protein